jgi:hypothetical protein
MCYTPTTGFSPFPKYCSYQICQPV